MKTLVVSEQDLRARIHLDNAALAAVENAFTWLAQGRVSMPPVMHIEIDPDSAIDTKGAYVSGLDAFAIKIASGFVRNPARGLPSNSSTIVLLDAETGSCRTVFLDNGYLMDLRTGLAGAVAAKHLASPEAETVGVIGTGAQARAQIECLALVRSFRQVLVHGRDAAKTAAYCAEMSRILGVPVTATGAEDLVRRSQIVVTTTHATAPLISADWLHPGLHITAMGSDLPGKQELDPMILSRADIVACDSRVQCEIGGELQALAGTAPDREILELGELTSGTRALPDDPDRISICDLTGMGVQDTAIATHADRVMRAAGLGTEIG